MKPIIHYDNTQLSVIALGRGAVIAPIDHTNPAPGQSVSNIKHVITSRVIKLHYDGSFETENTIYKPKKDTSCLSMIVARADGEQIQFRNLGDINWKDVVSGPIPMGWHSSMEYRVKPKEVKLIPHWPAIINSGQTTRITQSVYSSIEEAKRIIPSSLVQRVLRLATEYPPIMLPEKEPILERR